MKCTRCREGTQAATGLRRILAVLAACTIALSFGGCGLESPAESPAHNGPRLSSELLLAEDLGPFLDDIEQPANEGVISAEGGFVEEVQRQAVIDNWRRTIVAEDLSSVVSIDAVRFRNAEFGRALLAPKGALDPDPPGLPSGAVATVGEIASGYSERAALFAKGPTFVRVEVVSTGRGAPSNSRVLLARVSLAQFAKVSRHASLPGNSVKSGVLKRRLAIGLVGGAIAILLVASLLTAIRDPDVKRSALNRARGRPAQPPHAVDVDLLARVRRSRLRRDARHRGLVTVVVLVVVAFLPVGLAGSLFILIGALVTWEIGASLLLSIRGDKTVRPRLFSGRDAAIGALAATSSLAIAAAGVFVGWTGVVVATLGSPGLGQSDLDRFRAMCLVVGAVALAFSRAPLAIGRRVAMRRLARRARADPRPEVLLLRSFADDALTIRVRRSHRSGLDRLALRRWERFEEALSFGLFEVGPVEAVGEPGQFLPPLGAARTYYADDDWHGGVAARIGAAALVVVSVGRTPALSWEIGEIRRQGALGRTVFVIPPVSQGDRRARLHLLAARLEISPGLLDHEEPGLEVLSVVVPDGRRPTLVTSGVRDDTSYDLALRTAVAILAGEVSARPATLSGRSAADLPNDLTSLPAAHRRRRPWYRRPLALAGAAIAGLLLFNWGFTTRETTQRFAAVVDLDSTPRFFVPIPDSSKVVVVRNKAEGVAVTEIDAPKASTREVTTINVSPTRGSAAGEWVALTAPSDRAVTGVNLRTGRSWTKHLVGAPMGVAVGRHTALVALTGLDQLAELRLRDGAVLRQRPLTGAPYGVAATPNGWLVSLARADDVVNLDGALRVTAAPQAVSRPRQVFHTHGGTWAVTAATGDLAHLPVGQREGRLHAREFLPKVAASGRYVAVANSDDEITVADAQTGARLRTIRPPFGISAIALTPSQYVLVALNGYRDVGLYRPG